MNQKLGLDARNAIRSAMTGLVGTPAKQEAERLAEQHAVSWQYIYSMTKDLREGKRKRRSDAGKRSFELVEGTDVWTAAQLVIADKLDPDQALLVCRTRNPDAHLPTLEYFRQMLAAKGLGKKQRRSGKTAFRRWEAEQPGELFQIDVTALKVRWRDEKTRRIMQILGVDKNHPQQDPNILRVWQILLTDDHSRRRFLRYFVARAITSDEMVRFMCEAYNLLGVPLGVYTDQGGEFKGRHTKAAKILNALPTIRETGGYLHTPHSPNNAKATGKVEVGHKWAEKMDRLVGLADTEGQNVTLETLNVFADRICDHYNNSVHRTTNETPMFRWHNKRIVVRKLPAEIIESALLSDIFPARLDESMTITRNGLSYRVPSYFPGTTQKAPFVDYVGRKVLVVIPPAIDVILITLPNTSGKFEPDHGGEFEIEKVIATADVAGEFRSVAESTAEGLTKRLKDTRKEQVRALKAQNKLTGEIAPVPHFNVEIQQPQTNVAAFPHQERIVPIEEIAAITPLPTGAQPDWSASVPLATRSEATGSSASTQSTASTRSTSSTPHSEYSGREMSYWEAVAELTPTHFAGSVEEAKQFLLGLFPDKQGTVAAAVIETAINTRYTTEKEGLRAVG